MSAGSLFKTGLLLVFICWTGTTIAAFSVEDEFLQLKENYFQMREIVKSLESKVTELELKNIEMQEKDAKMQEKVTELEVKVQQQDSLLISLFQEKNEPKETGADSNQSAVAINGLPSSCDDLKTIGHTLNGFYSVMGSAMMESVYCDFSKLPSDAGFQKWIGYADVKSAPVHFYVQRDTYFNTVSTPIPFDVAVVNEGNAMDLTTGKFTAPRPGIYFFSFTGHADFQASSSSVYLGITYYLNGVRIGVGWIEEANTVDYQDDQVTIQSTLNLKKGDQIWVEIFFMSPDAFLYEDGYRYTHFMGFMLEEEIAASL